MISLQRVLNSSLSLRLVSALAQRLPLRIGYRIAYFVADRIAAERGMLGMIASDIIDELPAGLRSLSAAV